MKKLLYIVSALCLVFASCDLADDRFKEYADADDLFPVKILWEKDQSGNDNMVLNPAEESYVPGQAYAFDPVFQEGWEPEPGRYKYSWYFMFEATPGVTERYDLIKKSDTPSFQGVIPGKMPASTIPTLYFEVWDPKLDVRAIGMKGLRLTPPTIGGNGIYILKDMGGKTDVDFFELRSVKPIGDVWTPPTNEKLQNTLRPDIIKNGTGEPLDGAPMSIAKQEYNYMWYNPLSQQSENKGGAWFVATKNDMVTMTLTFGEVLNHFDDNFYDFMRPATINPQALNNRINSWSSNASSTGVCVWFVNDNQIWSVAAPPNGAVPTKFNTGATPSDGIPINATQYLFATGGALFWETNRQQLCHLRSNSSAVTVFAATSYKTTEGKDLMGGKKVEMVTMLPGGGTVRSMTANSNDFNSHMILKNKENSDHYLVKWRATSAATGDVWVHNIPVGADIIATPTPKMLSSFYNEVIYYVKGNQIWKYEDQNKPFGETAELSNYQRDTGARIGDGETVVNLKAINFEYSALSANNHFGITVLTATSDGGYKFYIFVSPTNNNEFNAAPDYVVKGLGVPVDNYTRLDYQIGAS